MRIAVARLRRPRAFCARKTSDPERGIVVNRLALSVLTLCGLTLYGAANNITNIMMGHLIGSLLVAGHFRFWPGTRTVRMIVGNLVDLSAGVAMFHIGGSSTGALYPLFLWIILGHGFRFGINWLFATMALGAVAFTYTILTVPFWLAHPGLSYGLLGGIIAVPLYASTLIVRLSKARDAAEQANRAKSLFLASVSHELRTPLNAIIGYGTHLERADLHREQHQMVAASVSAGRHLLHLINQLLTLSQSETDETKARSQAFIIPELIAEVRDILRLEAQNKGLDITLEGELGADRPIVANLDAVRNILLNLVGNAVKFTSEGSIHIRCAVVDTDHGARLEVTVGDTGPGIPAEAQERIFDLFTQADNDVREEYGGTGLGLAICRELARALGGEVTVDSQPGHGSRFTLSCPVELSDRAIGPDSARVLVIRREGEAEPNQIQRSSEDEPWLCRHLALADGEDPATAVRTLDLSTYDVALLTRAAAGRCTTDGELWSLFRADRLAPVLLNDDGVWDAEDVRLRAAFATVLPPGASSAEMRSAVRIGCSFGAGSKPASKSGDTDVVQPRSVLLADDNRVNRMVFDTILSDAGHRVTCAIDGEEALEALERGGFDIAFIDVNMPRVDGITCCRRYRARERNDARMPVVGLTADATEETEKRCLDAGMDLRMTKPVEAETLLRTVADMTSRERLSSSERRADPVPVANDDGRDPVDRAKLQELVDLGGAEFVRGVVEAYCEDADATLTALRASLDEGDADAFRFHAHALKSSSGNVGAIVVAERCEALESVRDERFATVGGDEFAKIETEVRAAIDALNSAAAQTVERSAR